MKSERLDQVRFATCAVGYLKVPLEQYASSDQRKPLFDIVGSGFVVAPERVLTCKHVISDLVSQMRKKKLSSDRAQLEFVYASGNRGWTTAFRRFREVWSDKKFDLAFLAFQLDSMPEFIAPIAPDKVELEVGDRIALCGYPHGTILLRDGGRLMRFGPILQQGFISALSPYDRAEPNAILLDVRVGPAASGSPVFLPDSGEVVGILKSGNVGKHATTAFATPIVRRADGGIQAWTPEPFRLQ